MFIPSHQTTESSDHFREEDRTRYKNFTVPYLTFNKTILGNYLLTSNRPILQQSRRPCKTTVCKHRLHCILIYLFFVRRTSNTKTLLLSTRYKKFCFTFNYAILLKSPCNTSELVQLVFIDIIHS